MTSNLEDEHGRSRTAPYWFAGFVALNLPGLLVSVATLETWLDKRYRFHLLPLLVWRMLAPVWLWAGFVAPVFAGIGVIVGLVAMWHVRPWMRFAMPLVSAGAIYGAVTYWRALYGVGWGP